MNLLIPMLSDDYAYSFIWDGSQDGNFQNNIGKLYRVESFGDILTSQWSHYFTWGGRTVAHIFVQFFCWQGKLLFDVLNALMYAALALLIYFIGTGKFNLRGGLLLWIFFAMWFCLPEFFKTTIWLTGSCNYLWMTVLQLLFLLPFAMAYRNQKPVPNFRFLVPIIALPAGWSNESGGAMIIFLTFLALIYFWRQKRLERWMVACFALFFVGYALLMLAPGNAHRFEIDSDTTEEMLFTVALFVQNFDDGLRKLIIYDAILFLPIIGYFLRGKKSVQETPFILAFTAAGVLLPCLLMFSPVFPARAAFASPIFLIIASIAALERIDFHLPQKILVAALSVWLVTICYAIGVDWSVHSQITERMEYIAAHKQDDLIVVKPIILPATTEKIFWLWTLDEYARFYQDLTPYTDDYNNRNITYAQYYGLKKIVADKEIWLSRKQFELY